jgi:glycerol kinase
MKSIIRVDGGMSASDWTMQFLADVLDVQVDRPTVRETTALGAALLAGWQAGVFPTPDAFAAIWRLDRSFRPTMPENIRDQRYRGWRDAMARTLLPPAN